MTWIVNDASDIVSRPPRVLTMN